uniref:DUF5648 domain-containing protein n=1 Tax=Clytia hemisphaerica TaxID=252671 RepID=A0A7M5XD48_9CNID
CFQKKSSFLIVPLYRYYNPKIVDHFYTASWTELGNGKDGWKLEGVQCRIMKCKASESVPLYRYCKSGLDHFYTTNIKEIGTATPGNVGNHGYKSEGITGYCYPVKKAGTIPLYRYWHPRFVNHFYTTNAKEIGTTTSGQVGKYGYKSEGITCYVFPN